MWRKKTCAVSGTVLACAAVYGLSSIDASSSTANFDTRWFYSAPKADRLPLAQMPGANQDMLTFNVPSASTTIAAKSLVMMQPAYPQIEQVQDMEQVQAGPHVSGVTAQASRVKVRTIPVNPVRTVPSDEKLDVKDVKKKEKLPVGCEPAFSPVTNPAMAHISSRCDA